MTKTTDTRQLRLLIDGILKAFDIDDLQITSAIMTGVRKFFESDTPAKTREDYLNEIRKAMGKHLEQQTLDEQIEQQFKRFPLNWMAFNESDKDTFRRFIKSEHETGSELSVFVGWWLQDEWRLAHPPTNIFTIMQRWPMAFSNRINHQSNTRRMETL